MYPFVCYEHPYTWWQKYPLKTLRKHILFCSLTVNIEDYYSPSFDTSHCLNVDLFFGQYNSDRNLRIALFLTTIITTKQCFWCIFLMFLYLLCKYTCLSECLYVCIYDMLKGPITSAYVSSPWCSSLWH